jgi:pimeloyl-ACP methyl ester carboxylesterase
MPYCHPGGVHLNTGKHDPIVPPPNGQLLADNLPRSRYILLEGVHLIWEDAPQEYAANIVSWLQGGYRLG